MMSFLRRLALKSVMAAKKDSVLQYGVGRLDGANTMTKTIQYLAKAVPESLQLLTSRLPSRMSRAMLYSIEQNDADLAAVFSKWYTGITEHRMHHVHQDQCQQLC